MMINVKRLLIVSLMNLVGLTMYAQSDIEILNQQKVVGKNYLTNKDIIAKEIVFPEKIYKTYIDTSANCITVQLRYESPTGKITRNNGNIVVYDLGQKKEKWSKKINYIQTNIDQFNDLFIETTAGKSYSLNAQNGEIQWEVKNKIIYNDPYQKIGLGYKIKGFGPENDLLQGIDLRNGHIKWTTPISRHFGWNNVVHLNDSTLIIVSSGIHSIHLKNGSGWDYSAQTGENILDLLTGDYQVYGEVSNLIGDSTNIYLASKQKITRLNQLGQVLWSTPLPMDLTSKSHIFKEDSILYLVNYGYAYRSYQTYRAGTPFIAAFNANTGKQVYLKTVGSKKEKITGFQTSRGQIYLVFTNKMAQYTLLDGSLIQEKTFKIKPDEYLVDYVGPQVYIKTDSVYHSLALSDSTTHCILTENNKILVMNAQFQIIRTMDYEDVYFNAGREKNCRFLVKGDKTIVINDDQKKVASIDVSMKTRLIGTKFYSIRDKSFLELDIKEIINHNIP